MTEQMTEQAVTPEQTNVNPFKPRPLKPLFAKASVTWGYNPREPERARIYLMGLRKQFKTSFAASNPDAVILDFEGGANAVMSPRAYVVNLSGTATKLPTDSGYAEERAWLLKSPLDRYLLTKKLLLEDAKSADPQFKTVVIDSMDLFIEHKITEFCRDERVENIGDYRSHGAGYSKVCERITRELQDFEDAGYGMVLIAHLGEQKDDTGKITIGTRITGSFHKTLLMKVDQVMTINLLSVSTQATRDVEQNGKVVKKVIPGQRDTKVTISLRTMPLPDNVERGCRVQIPDGLELPLSDAWAVYADAYRKEVQRVKSTLQ